MPSLDLSTGSESAQAQAQNQPESDQNSPEPKRRKLDGQGDDDNHPNGDIEKEGDGNGKQMEDTGDESEEYMDDDAFMAWLKVSTSDPSKKPTDKIFPWDIEEDKCVEETLVYDPERWVGCRCSICGKFDIHPTVFCPYLQFFPEDGELAPNAPATIVDILSGEELESGPGRAVIDMSKVRAR